MKKLFTNDKFFLVMILFAVVGEFVAFVGTLSPNGPIVPIVRPLLFIFCVVTLFVSYKVHNKNVMKGMMGALLMFQILKTLSFAADDAYKSYTLYTAALSVLTIALFLNHFVLNSERQANGGMVRLNQIIVLLIAVVNIAWQCVKIVDMPTAGVIVNAIADIVGILGISATIVCVESRLDAYRTDREGAGWTEEKGYPEGYVHECDKQ